MTDADLIAAFIAKNGVTQCPPRTYALPPVETWKELQDRSAAILRRKRRFDAAKLRAAEVAGRRRVHAEVSIEEIIAAGREGKTIGQMAVMFGMSEHAIKMRLRRRGLNVTKLREAA